MQERGKITQTHRYYSTRHNLKPGNRILTGEYLRSPYPAGLRPSPSRQKPPKALAQAIGMPVPPALMTMRNESETERLNSND
jgi:NAD(P)H-quinone oxidoreductase subunit K